MWHFQPVLSPVAFVARHFEPGKGYGSPYDAIALVSRAQNDGPVLLHGTLSKRGDISRDQWRELILGVASECSVSRVQADRKAKRVEFVIEGGLIRLVPVTS